VEEVQVTPAEMVEEYIQLRDAKRLADEKYAEFVKTTFSDKMQALEVQLLDTLNKLGVDSLSSKEGTVYRKLTTSVTVADARDFRQFVTEGENWDLIDWRANKTAVNDLVEAGEPVPPGVNRSSFYSVGIRRKS